MTTTKEIRKMAREYPISDEVGEMDRAEVIRFRKRIVAFSKAIDDLAADKVTLKMVINKRFACTLRTPSWVLLYDPVFNRLIEYISSRIDEAEMICLDKRRADRAEAVKALKRVYK